MFYTQHNLDTLSNIYDSIEKTAEETGEFDETPAAVKKEQGEQGEGQRAQQQPQPQAQPQQSPNVAAKPSASQEEQTPQQPQVGPEQMAAKLGVQAAQEFLSDQMIVAAYQGHPGAQKIVAQTAGEIAGKMADAALKHMSRQAASQPAQEEAPPPQQQMEQQPPQQQNRPNGQVEERVADQVIGDQSSNQPRQQGAMQKTSADNNSFWDKLKASAIEYGREKNTNMLNKMRKQNESIGRPNFKTEKPDIKSKNEIFQSKQSKE